MRRLAACCGLVVSLIASPVAAEPIEVSAGITVNALTGKHDTGATVQRLTLLPLPIGEAELRASHYLLRVEGLPPLVVTLQDQRTSLSILNASLRAFAPGNVLYGGIGETVYNQSTTGGERALAGPNATHRSRVVGLRVEAGVYLPIRANDRLEVNVAYNPKMHGVVFTTYTFNDAVATYSESAAQVDIALRRVLRRERTEFMYGLRYINYSARYDIAGSRADGLLADRNVGVLPLVGIRYRL